MLVLVVVPASANIAQDGALYRLASRMLAGLDGPTVDVQLFTGEVPPLVPTEMPMMENAVLVGSIERTDVEVGAVRDVTVLIDAPYDTSEVLMFYHRELLGLGWRPLLNVPTPRPPSFPLVYCWREDWPYLILSVSPVGEGSEVRATAVWLAAFPSPCAQSPIDAAFNEVGGGEGVVPALVIPPDTALLQTRIHPDPYRSYYSMEIETGLDAPAIETHFAAQLEGLGWTLILSDSNATLAWSAWEVEHERHQYLGTLTILAGEQSDLRTVYLDVIPWDRE